MIARLTNVRRFGGGGGGGSHVFYSKGIRPRQCFVDTDMTLISAQCLKTFYVRNLRMLVISYSVCVWQAFPN